MVLLEEVKHVAPTNVLGTSCTGEVRHDWWLECNVMKMVVASTEVDMEQMMQP